MVEIDFSKLYFRTNIPDIVRSILNGLSVDSHLHTRQNTPMNKNIMGISLDNDNNKN